MALLRQNAYQEIFIPLPMDRAYQACLRSAKKIGKISNQTDAMHCFVLKTPLTLLPVVANPVELRVSLLPGENGCKVQFSGESPDGAVGIGSVGKVISRMQALLAKELKP